MKVLLAFGGLERPGGITPDLRNLELGLAGLGVEATTAGDLRAIVTRLRHRDVDVVHVFGCLPSTTIFGGLMASHAFGCRVVWTPVFHPNRLGYWRGRYRIMAAFDRMAVRAAKLSDAVVAATPAEAAFFRSVGAPRCDVNPPVVQTVPGRLTGDEWRSARRRFGVGDGPMVLVVAAHSARRKGLDVAAAALRQLRGELGDVSLLLAGGGDSGALMGEPGVVATGWLSDDDLELAYGCADVLLVPSRYEQFSRATLEAWAHGVPVVLSDGVGLAAVADGAAGIVVPYGDANATAAATVRLLRDRGLAARFGLAGVALASDRYSIGRHAAQMVQLYDEILAGTTSASRVAPRFTQVAQP